MIEELRQALRALVRHGVFTSLVLVTLGVGIGASTAIFSVVEAVLLRPLPYEEPERLVFIWNRLGDSRVDKSAVAAPDFVDYVEKTRYFAGFVGWFTTNTSITEEAGRPEPVNMAFATPNFFSLLGSELFLGQMYGPEDEGRAAVSDMQNPDAELPTAPVIVSYELWQRRYGGDPGALGRRVEVNGQPMVIQGVAPRGFHLFLPPEAAIPERIDVWTPFSFSLREGSRTTQFITVIARLKPGATLGDAGGEMDAIAAWQREHFEYHKSADIRIQVVPMHEDVTGKVRPYLMWFLVAAGLVLALTCSNVTNLLLLRSWEQRREMSIRAALGGGPRRLAARALLQSTLLALLGGALGLLLGQGGIRLLLALQPENLPRVEEAGIDWTVLGIALGLALVAALACGLVPAYQVSRPDLTGALRERSASAGPAQQRLRKGLVVVEIAISLFLLIHTALMLRTLQALGRVDPGFRPRNVLTAKLALPFFKYPEPERRADFFQELVRRAAAIPGVEAASGGYPLPLSEGRQFWFGPWSAESADEREWTKNEADFRGVMPGYFETLGIPLLKGRLLTLADNRYDAPKVAIVDDVLAPRAWPGQDPVGKRLLIWEYNESGTGIEPVWVDVVGMVAHVRGDDLTRDGQGTVYCPQRFYGWPELILTLKSTTSDPLSLAAPLREVVLGLDPDQPLFTVRLMQDYIDDALAPTRFALALIGAFALIATSLAAVGHYGVVSSAVQQRTHEIGIRMAFGAEKRRILAAELRQSMGLALRGLVLGLGAALLSTRGLSTLLFGVAPTDPLTFAAITVVQVLIALVASLIPAWRATQVDPVEVLNAE